MNKYMRPMLLAGLVLMGACKKDEGLNSKNLVVYVKGEYGSTNNSVTAALTLTPVSVWGNTQFQFYTYSTRGVTADVSVFLYPDTLSLQTFNLVNNKKCKLLPAGSYTIDNNQHTIKKDSTQSDPLNVQITNASALTDTNGYVLPLTVTKVTSVDHGIGVSTSLHTAYLYVPYSYTNVDSVQTVLSDGVVASRTGWAVTVSNTTSGAPGPAMLDGSNSTAWRSSNSSTAAKYVILNMGGVQTIRGLQLTPNYVTTGENATQIRVSTSGDSVSWAVQGIWRGTGPATGSSAATPDLKGINFISPVNTKYVRLDILSWVSTNRVGIGELNVIQ